MRPFLLLFVFVPSVVFGWTHYAGDARSTKFAPLTEIGAENFDQVRVIWTWQVPDGRVGSGMGPDIFRSTPVVHDGVLYTSTPLNQAAAIDAATGQELWTFDPQAWKVDGADRMLHRGVTYWRDGEIERVFFGTSSAFLFALDARTGQPDPGFGQGGRVDLGQGLRRPIDRQLYAVASPPTVCRGVVVVGSTIQDWRFRPPDQFTSPGDVRGYDARTGQLLWTFHTIPQEGEYGNDTWLNDAWKTYGSANVWAVISADEERGLLYLAVSTPSHDFYGGERPGDNLYGDSIVCVEAATGRRVWHYQLIRHGLWDYDPPSAPIVADIEVDGRPVEAVVQLTKQGFAYVFDRVTGEPVWPIEERPVPQSNVPGEQTAPTQPFPTKPAAFDRQGLSADDLIDFTPELRAEALRIVSQYDYGPLYTPPSERGAVLLPGLIGGADWVGGAFDPERGLLFVPSHTIPSVVTVGAVGDPDASSRYRSMVNNDLNGPQGLPLTKPPYGRLTAIDLNSGEHRWMRPVGRGPVDHPALRHLDLPDLGWPTRTFVVATPELVLTASQGAEAFSGGGDYFIDPRSFLEAYDPDDGRLIGRVELPGVPFGNPAVFDAGGRQCIAVPVGGDGDAHGRLAVLAVPRPGEKLPPQGMARQDAEHPQYYRAVAAFDAGDAHGLKKLLQAHPDLVRARGWLDEEYGYGYFRGATLLHHVAGNPVRARLPDNVLALARLLLDHGADPNAVTLDTLSTLGLVVSGAQPRWNGVQEELIALLIDQGADPNLGDGRLLWTALTYDEKAAAKALYASGARVDLRFASALGLMQKVQKFFDEQGQLKDEQTRLFRPLGDTTMTPQQRLDEALGFAALAGHAPIAAFLLERGADIDAKPPGISWPDDQGNTALHKAVQNENRVMVEFLLAQGADPTVADNNYGSTPGGWAGYFGYDGLARLLHKAEALHAAKVADAQK